MEARWLLNVASMTLGSYPDGVPRQFLIPPTAFRSDYPLPRFDNVAKEVGLDIYALSVGAVLDDFDNDGRLDLMVSRNAYRCGSAESGTVPMNPLFASGDGSADAAGCPRDQRDLP